MESPFIRDRRALRDAAELIERYGPAAASQAAVRASTSRDAGNVLRFCHWRQIERVIALLSHDEPLGSIH